MKGAHNACVFSVVDCNSITLHVTYICVHDFGLVNVSISTNLFMLMITYFGITYLCSLNLNLSKIIHVSC